MTVVPEPRAALLAGEEAWSAPRLFTAPVGADLSDSPAWEEIGALDSFTLQPAVLDAAAALADPEYSLPLAFQQAADTVYSFEFTFKDVGTLHLQLFFMVPYRAELRGARDRASRLQRKRVNIAIRRTRRLIARRAQLSYTGRR